MPGSFVFHPELFEQRARLLDHLADHGLHWREHFGAVDLAHDTGGLEVCGIHEHGDARRIRARLQRFLPEWPHTRLSYRDHSLEDGWKVTISERGK